MSHFLKIALWPIPVPEHKVKYPEHKITGDLFFVNLCNSAVAFMLFISHIQNHILILSLRKVKYLYIILSYINI